MKKGSTINIKYTALYDYHISPRINLNFHGFQMNICNGKYFKSVGSITFKNDAKWFKDCFRNIEKIDIEKNNLYGNEKNNMEVGFPSMCNNSRSTAPTLTEWIYGTISFGTGKGK